MNKTKQNLIASAIAWTMFALGVGIGLTGKAYAEKHGAGNSAEIVLCYDRPFVERKSDQGKVSMVPDPLSKVVKSYGLMDLWEGEVKSFFPISSDLTKIQNEPISKIQNEFLSRLAKREPETAERLEKTLLKIGKEKKITENAELARLADSNVIGISPPQDLGNYCYTQQLVFQIRKPEPTQARYLIHKERYEKFLPSNLHRFLTLVHEAVLLWEVDAANAQIQKLNATLLQLEKKLANTPALVSTALTEREILKIEKAIEGFENVTSDEIRPYLYTISSSYFDQSTAEEYFAYLHEKGRLNSGMTYQFTNYPPLKMGPIESKGGLVQVSGVFLKPYTHRLTGNEYSTSIAEGAQAEVVVSLKDLSPPRLSVITGNLVDKEFRFLGGNIDFHADALAISMSGDWVEQDRVDGESALNSNKNGVIQLHYVTSILSKGEKVEQTFLSGTKRDQVNVSRFLSGSVRFATYRGQVAPARVTLRSEKLNYSASFSDCFFDTKEIGGGHFTFSFDHCSDFSGSVNGVPFLNENPRYFGGSIRSFTSKDGLTGVAFSQRQLQGFLFSDGYEVIGNRMTTQSIGFSRGYQGTIYLRGTETNVFGGGKNPFNFNIEENGILTATGGISLREMKLPFFSDYAGIVSKVVVDSKGKVKEVEFTVDSNTKHVRIKSPNGVYLKLNATGKRLRVSYDANGDVNALQAF
jgi:hypothetical protein